MEPENSYTPSKIWIFWTVVCIGAIGLLGALQIPGFHFQFGYQAVSASAFLAGICFFIRAVKSVWELVVEEKRHVKAYKIDFELGHGHPLPEIIRDMPSPEKVAKMIVKDIYFNIHYTSTFEYLMDQRDLGEIFKDQNHKKVDNSDLLRINCTIFLHRREDLYGRPLDKKLFEEKVLNAIKNEIENLAGGVGTDTRRKENVPKCFTKEVAEAVKEKPYVHVSVAFLDSKKDDAMHIPKNEYRIRIRGFRAAEPSEIVWENVCAYVELPVGAPPDVVRLRDHGEILRLLQSNMYTNPVLITKCYDYNVTFGPYSHCDVVLPDLPLMFTVTCKPGGNFLDISFNAKHLEDESVEILPDIDAENSRYFGLTDYKGKLMFKETAGAKDLIRIDQSGSVKIPLTTFSGHDRKFRAKLRIGGATFTLSNRINALQTNSKMSVYSIHPPHDRPGDDELIDRILKSMATDFYRAVSYKTFERRIDELEEAAQKALLPLRKEACLPMQIRIAAGPQVGRELDYIAMSRGKPIEIILKEGFVDLLELKTQQYMEDEKNDTSPLELNPQPETQGEYGKQGLYKKIFRNVRSKAESLISETSDLVLYETLEESRMFNNQLGYCDIAVRCSFNPVPKEDGSTPTWGKVKTRNWDGTRSSDPNIHDGDTALIFDNERLTFSETIVGGLPVVSDLFLPGLQGEIVAQVWFFTEGGKIPEKALFVNSTMDTFEMTEPNGQSKHLNSGDTESIDLSQIDGEYLFSFRQITSESDNGSAKSVLDDGNDGAKRIEVTILQSKKRCDEYEEVMHRDVSARLCGINILLHLNHDTAGRRNAFKKRFSDNLVKKIYNAFGSEDEILGIEYAGGMVFAVVRDSWGEPLLDLYNAGDFSIKLKIMAADGDSHNRILEPDTATCMPGGATDDAMFLHGLPKGKIEIEHLSVTIHVFGSSEIPAEPDMFEKTIELHNLFEDNKNGFSIPGGCRLIWAEVFPIPGLEKGLYRCMLTQNRKPVGCLVNASDHPILICDKLRRDDEITVDPMTCSPSLTSNEYRVALLGCKNDLCYLHFGSTFWDRMPLLSRQMEMYYSVGWIETDWFWLKGKEEGARIDPGEVPLHPKICRNRPFGELFEQAFGNLSKLDQHFFQDALFIDYNKTLKMYSFRSRIPETRGKHNTIKTVFHVQKPEDGSAFGYPGKQFTMDSLGNYCLRFCGLVFQIRNGKSIYADND